MWSTFDTDGDGQLDVLEFNALMQYVVAQAKELEQSNTKPPVDTQPEAISGKSKLFITVISASGLKNADFLGENSHGP